MEVKQKKCLKNENLGQSTNRWIRKAGNKLKLLLNLTYKEKYV